MCCDILYLSAAPLKTCETDVRCSKCEQSPHHEHNFSTLQEPDSTSSRGGQHQQEGVVGGINIVLLLASWFLVKWSWFVKNQFTDDTRAVRALALIEPSGQGDSLSSLRLAVVNRRHVAVLLTGILRRHLFKNVWSCVSGMAGAVIVSS